MKNILVTGGASGIGRAIVERFLQGGWRVGAFDIDQAALDDLKRQHPAGQLVTGILDVRDAEAWHEALNLFCGDGEALDVLVNNAGTLAGGKFTEVPLPQQLLMVDVNVKGTLIGCYAAHSYLRRASDPQVINLASASAIYGQAELAVYSATKFAMRGLTEALDLEWAQEGIRVQAIWPLYVSTAMTDGLDIATTRALGVRLTPADVAKHVWKAVHRSHRLDGVVSVHRSVGNQAAVALASANISPSAIVRWTNRRLAKQ